MSELSHGAARKSSAKAIDTKAGEDYNTPMATTIMTIPRVQKNWDAVRPFIGKQQWRCLLDLQRGEEGKFFEDKIAELAALVQAMPSGGATDGQGEEAIVQLHYFKGGADWWIIEKDEGSPDDAPEEKGRPLQAFGLADLFGDGGELGYISIDEVTGLHGELDLHWSTKTLRECRRCA